MDWLDSVIDVLDRRRAPLEIFFRDDDAGWADAALLRLVDDFADRRVPLDLAVIPAALSPALASELRDRVGPSLGLHQHGWQHTNHELAGRKCEFGESRSVSTQHADLRAGRDLLAERFSGSVDPIFTPPWNRCTSRTAEALGVLGFAALSRSTGATAVTSPRGLVELPVAVDWQKWRAGDGPDLPALARVLVAAIESTDAQRSGSDDRSAACALGIMLHHAPMVDADFKALRALLTVVASHRAVRCRAMRELLPSRVAQEHAA